MIHGLFSHRLTGYVLLALIVLASSLLLVKPLARLSHKIFIDYNEGAMAYYSEAAMRHTPMYMPVEELTLNNYPPLSFYVTGFVGSAVGDQIVGGRIVAMAGIFITALMMSLIIFLLTRSMYLSVAGAALFLGYMCIYHGEYVGMNDPQWIAHGLMMCGFALFLYKPDSRAMQYCSMILMLLAGLMKHNLLPIPLASTAWLFFYDRKRFYEWVAAGATLVVIALLAMHFMYGKNFLPDLFGAPRVYRAGPIARVGLWLTPLIIYVVMSVLLCVLDFRKEVRLLLMTACLSLVWGIFISGGGGVSYNAIFDYIIMTFTASFVAADSLTRFVKAKLDPGISLVPYAMVVLSLPVLLKTPYDLYLTKEFLKSLPQLEKQSEADIAFIARFPDPVMCENLAFAYWAGKEYAFDFYSTGQKLKTGSMDWSVVRNKLLKKEFSLIQIGSANEAKNFLSDEITEQIFQNYTPIRESNVAGLFLAPQKK